MGLSSFAVMDFKELRIVQFTAGSTVGDRRQRSGDRRQKILAAPRADWYVALSGPLGG
jgi:hypothetical protein